MNVINAVPKDVGGTGYHAKARFRVRLLSTLTAVGAVCVLAVAACQYSSINAEVVNHVKPGFMVELDIFAIILLSLTIIWDAVNFLHDRIAHRSIRSGARVALELLGWLGLSAVVVVLLSETIDFYEHPIQPAVGNPIGLQYLGITMLCMACVSIFVLFVYACRETHLRRRSKREIAAILLQQKTEIELTPRVPVSVPAPVIVSCNCQEEIYDHLVAGASSDQPPQYPAVAREMHMIEQGKAASFV